MKNFLLSERTGFAISFEICLSMLLLTVVTSVTLYFVQVFETERFFADVTASTCTLASRFGGNDSMAYRIQVKKGTISQNANKQLHYINSLSNQVKLVPMSGSDFITVSSKPDANNMVTVHLAYKVGKISWGKLVNIVSPKNGIEQTFRLPSLMQNGSLV